MNKKLTIDDVLKVKKSHPLRGYQSRFDFGRYLVSIVGGRTGLYGDFENTFEVAIIDNKDGSFVTKLFCGGGDVAGYCSKEEVEGILNIFASVPSEQKGGGVD